MLLDRRKRELFVAMCLLLSGSINGFPQTSSNKLAITDEFVGTWVAVEEQRPDGSNHVGSVRLILVFWENSNLDVLQILEQSSSDAISDPNPYGSAWSTTYSVSNDVVVVNDQVFRWVRKVNGDTDLLILDSERGIHTTYRKLTDGKPFYLPPLRPTKGRGTGSGQAKNRGREQPSGLRPSR